MIQQNGKNETVHLRYNVANNEISFVFSITKLVSLFKVFVYNLTRIPKILTLFGTSDKCVVRLGRQNERNFRCLF